MPDVFVSYRSADARFGAAAVYELLSSRFGKDRLFLDNQSIPAGTPYSAELDRALKGHVIAEAQYMGRFERK